MIDIEFVTASHSNDILNDNLWKSPIIQKYGVNVIRGYTNIPKAYNSIQIQFSYKLPDQFKKPLIVYVHQDVYLPESFESDLNKAIEQVPKDWEVLGVAGVKLIDGKKFNRGHILDRGKEWGGSTNPYNKVDTLDELLLITRGDIKFDEQFEQDFYGADICMGRNCYAINAFVHHNSSRKIGQRTESFYRSEKLFRKKHIDKLPIITTCSLIS